MKFRRQSLSLFLLLLPLSRRGKTQQARPARSCDQSWRLFASQRRNLATLQPGRQAGSRQSVMHGQRHEKNRREREKEKLKIIHALRRGGTIRAAAVRHTRKVIRKRCQFKEKRARKEREINNDHHQIWTLDILLLPGKKEEEMEKKFLEDPGSKKRRVELFCRLFSRVARAFLMSKVHTPETEYVFDRNCAKD